MFFFIRSFVYIRIKVNSISFSSSSLGKVDQGNQLRTRSFVKIHNTHSRKSVAYDFVILSQESWMIKTCTGSQEVQKLWQTEAIFQHKNTIMSNQLFNDSFIFFQFINFIFQQICLRFFPSGEPRIVKSSFVVF